MSSARLSSLRARPARNVLMAQGLAKAYGRLYASGGQETRAVMEDHARLLVKDLQRASLASADVDSVTELLPDELRRAVTG